MSNAILNAIAKEQSKLLRQIDNLESTKAVLEVLGDDPREQAKVSRQEDAIKDTKSRIAKLQKAAGK